MRMWTPGVQEARHRFASALQSALTLDEVEQVFLGTVHDVIPAGGFGLYRLNAESGSVLSVRADVRSDFLENYEVYGRPDDPVLDFVIDQRRAIDSSRVIAPKGWTGSGAHSALAAGGFYHSLEAPIVVSGALYGTMNFARVGGDPSFSDSDLISARLVGEQLGLATERAVRFEATGRRTTLLEHVLDRVPQALVVTDLDATVLFRNRVARDQSQIAPAGTSLADRPGPIHQTISNAMEVFRSRGKRVHTSSVRQHPSGRQVIVKSYRLAGDQDAAVTLIFNGPDQETAKLPAWDVLSPREQDIAELVSHGLTTKQIAERAFVSENTVKQHLKRVFAKTDVRNRAELVQLIWTSGKQSGDEIAAS